MVVAFAAAIFLVAVLSPPSLMDDVDSVQAQIAHNMIQSGDWVTAHLDGVAYLEKSPLKYWLIATSFLIFGVHDWAARLPIAFSVILLCLVTRRFARWAMGETAGLYAGLALATCIGLFLFTRVLIPDAILTLTITIALWSLLRALDPDEAHTRRWALTFWAALGAGLLLKGLIAVLFPAGAASVWLLITGQWKQRETWHRLFVLPGILLMLLIAAPWHIAATLANPPYFDWTMHSESGSYHGFFWFYFINEHVLRFLNLRYPRDYNTVPRWLFWALHAVWFFPWTGYLLAAGRLPFCGADRASRTRLLALCWIGFVMIFFTFSTTQEYYSFPCYPAVALLIGACLATDAPVLRYVTRFTAGIAGLAAVVIFTVIALAWNLPAPGDISQALQQNPDLYTLSLGHATDLTLGAMAYLKLPLALAGLAALIGCVGALLARGMRRYVALAVMMVLFFQAARIALIAFEPYLGSRPLAEALNHSPDGQLIVDDQYYAFSSVFFYTNRTALLLNGRTNNLEYGSYAPGAPHVFIDDAGFVERWKTPQRYYVVADDHQRPRFRKLVGDGSLHIVKESGGKFLAVNQ
jgi:4-amino-4-deoxy-L-arabinose transferase-like glycosyltransferase